MVTPVEIKLGEEGLKRSSMNAMLGPWEPSGHSDDRWTCNMMAVLGRRFPEGFEPAPVFAKTADGKKMELTEEWVVIARPNVLKSWRRAEPNFTGGGKHTDPTRVCFDDIARRVGKEAFNRIVRELLDFDYFQGWIKEEDGDCKHRKAAPTNRRGAVLRRPAEAQKIANLRWE